MYVSRHHPVSSSTPINHPGVSSKWSKKQDEKLRQAVLKYGTQWSLISKKYRFDRSVNSLVKRWHGKLKEQAQKGVSNQSSSSDSEQEQKSQEQKSKRTRKQQKKEQKIQKMQKPKSRRGGYRPRRPKVPEVKQQSRDRSRNRKQSNAQKDEKQSDKRNMNVIEEESDNQSKQKQAENNEEIDSLENSESNFVFQHKWKDYEDKMLKEMILNDHILNWQELAGKLKVQNIRQVRKRWQYNVYPEIIEQRKIGGCLKYSEQQDAILSRGVKLGMTVVELRKFLPGRTQYSLEARRRRTLRMDEEQVPELRYWTKKLLAYKFVEKRHQHLEKPTQEDEFMYRSDSE